MNEARLEAYMRKAMELAENGRFHTFPNPATGAVLVKEGQIVAEGWHKKAGLPHAEIECLRDAHSRGIDTRGALMVVTLEPCVHHGRTPPCVDALLAARIGSLAYGSADPNPAASGGANKLANSGLSVFGPVLEQECDDLIADFKIWQTDCRPYSILKLAGSADGRIASRSGKSRWISSEESRSMVHGMRGLMGENGGAILIGGETFRQDNPALTARLVEGIPAEQPLACVLSSRLPGKDSHFALLRERPAQSIFFTSAREAASPNAEELRGLGCSVVPIPTDQNGKADLNFLMRYLWREKGCPYVYCEGGGKLALSLLKAKLVDEFHLHLAPILMGDAQAKPLLDGLAPDSPDEALRFRFSSVKLRGPDAHLVMRPARAK